MKFLIKLLALLLFPVFSFGQIKADKKISLFDDKVEILVPKELSNMSDKIWARKFHESPRPRLALSNESGEVSLLIDQTSQPATEAQMDEYENYRLKELKKNRENIKILGDGVRAVNGKNIAFIKFSSKAIDQNIFNYFAFAIVDGKILAINFNSTERLQKIWEKVADEMVGSLKIK